MQGHKAVQAQPLKSAPRCRRRHLGPPGAANLLERERANSERERLEQFVRGVQFPRHLDGS